MNIKIKGDNPNMNPVTTFLEMTFPGCQQQELHHNMVQYQLPNSMRVALIFSSIKEVKEKLNIEDYSVCQTTLDQVSCLCVFISVEIILPNFLRNIYIQFFEGVIFLRNI